MSYTRAKYPLEKIFCYAVNIFHTSNCYGIRLFYQRLYSFPKFSCRIAILPLAQVPPVTSKRRVSDRIGFSALQRRGLIRALHLVAGSLSSVNLRSVRWAALASCCRSFLFSTLPAAWALGSPIFYEPAGLRISSRTETVTSCKEDLLHAWTDNI